ncbi:MAG: wax ester/triacylglycerol synthase family O-acyltransferase [Anaerolineae bacterium]
MDAIWLRMEHATHPMMITISLLSDGPLDFARVRAIFNEHLLRFERFRQRVVLSAQPYWEDVPDFDLDDHLVRVMLPTPGDETALQGLISSLMGQQLDLARPPWQFHLVEGTALQGCALVGRVHHALADGPALLHVLLALSDTDAEPPEPMPDPGTQGVLAFPDVSLETVTRITGSFLQGGRDVLVQPARWLGLARLGRGALSATYKLLMRRPDPHSPFKGRLGLSKRVAWSAPVSLVDVKAIGRAVDGTVNDVMLAATSGALRRYVQSRGEPVDGVTIRAGLSVNLRQPDEVPALGNGAGAVLVPLRIGVADPVERLCLLKQDMDTIKSSPEAGLTFALLSALGTASPEMQKTLVDTYCTRDTAMIANVAGPQTTISLAGVPLRSIMFWVPALGGVGLALSVVSYAGRVWLGVATDEGLVPDPEVIVAGFQAEFDELLAWAEPPRVEDPVQAMMEMLDQALDRVDAMLADSEGS